MDALLGYHSLLVTRQSASTPMKSLRCRPVGGAPATASGLAVGAIPAIVGLLIPPSDGIGAGEGPRYVSKKDDVGGGISGGNWCGTARKNGTNC